MFELRTHLGTIFSHPNAAFPHLKSIFSHLRTIFPHLMDQFLSFILKMHATRSAHLDFSEFRHSSILPTRQHCAILKEKWGVQMFMFAMRRTQFAKWALLLLALVLTSNFLLYHSSFSSIIIPEESVWVVSGSLLDLALVAPLLLLAAFRLTAKQFIGLIASGIILARLLIPSSYIEPFSGLVYAAIGLEVLVIAAEAALIFFLCYHFPKILRSIKNQEESPLFTLFPATFAVMKPNPLVSVVLSEALVVYYAFFSWKKRAPDTPYTVSLHKNTSAIAFYIMLIHAIVIETIGIHWFLHEKSLMLSMILLILNIYSVFYFLAEIQAIRLNPLTVKDGSVQLSLGLSKRMTFRLDSIESIRWGEPAKKDTLEFIANDIETGEPQLVINFKAPQKATLFYGRTKEVSQIALKVDNPEKLKNLLEQ
ncbi:hypothetical protein BN1080_00804 [Planococcus massiliensis]|uniref:Beta-carotene 15,15'-monooxygenase n=2 Tax=Planococcus massiliensis TaxID=1499687 RepID=A0A098EJ96_9BACL|nr:hypothetical protein BN1080_00804 [Planococcus massiliensis]